MAINILIERANRDHTVTSYIDLSKTFDSILTTFSISN